MFFDDLEARQLFSASVPIAVLTTVPKAPVIAPLTLAAAAATAATAATAQTAATATTKVAVAQAPTSIVTAAPPSQGVVLKPGGASAALAGAAQATLDPSKIGSKPGGVGAATTTLPGGIVVSQNPFARFSAKDVAGVDAFRSALGSLLANSAMQGLLDQYGKSLDLAGGVIGSADPTARPDFLSLVMADLQAQTGTGASGGSVGTPGAVDPHRADGPNVPGGLGINPTAAELAAAKKAQEEKDKGTTTPPAATAPAPEKGVTETAKKVGEKLLDYAKDVVFERFGPPGPWTTILGAPDYVEKVTGDSKDLLNGFVAIFQSGDKNPANNPKESPDPNGDVTLEPQQQKAMNQVMAFFGRFLDLTPTLHDLGTSLISQPAGADGGSTAPKPDRNTLTTGGQAPTSDRSPYINPGSGDDGSVAVTGPTTGPLVPKAVVKDPVKPDGVLDTAGPGTTPPGGATPKAA